MLTILNMSASYCEIAASKANDSVSVPKTETSVKKNGKYIKNSSTDTVNETSAIGTYFVSRTVDNIYDCTYPPSGKVEDYGVIRCSECGTASTFEVNGDANSAITFWICLGQVYCKDHLMGHIPNKN